jgi:hypothetical protein
MKRTPFIPALIIAALAVPMPFAAAQETPPTIVERTDTTTTITADGTITEYGNQRLLVKSGPQAEPVTYSYSGSTIYVDESGAPLSVTTIKEGLPVRIQYIKTEKGPMVTKMIVRKAPPDPVAVANATKTTVTRGTVSELTADRLVVLPGSGADPVRYAFTTETTWVDEAGTPVSLALVNSGLPVTVQFTKVNGKLMATNVVVRKAPTIVKETKTTTVTGTISDFAPTERIVIRTENAAEPLAYTFAETTTFVDESGAPVAVDVVRSGLPVTLHYSTVGDARVVDRVVVRKTTTTTTKKKKQ